MRLKHIGAGREMDGKRSRVKCSSGNKPIPDTLAHITMPRVRKQSYDVNFYSSVVSVPSRGQEKEGDRHLRRLGLGGVGGPLQRPTTDLPFAAPKHGRDASQISVKSLRSRDDKEISSICAQKQTIAPLASSAFSEREGSHDGHAPRMLVITLPLGGSEPSKSQIQMAWRVNATLVQLLQRNLKQPVR